MDISFELRPKTGELRPQHNRPGESTTRDNVLEFDPNDYTLVNIRIETVQYGMHDGKAAALIVLRFIFKFRPGFKRIRNFHVDIKFSRYGASGAANTASFPKVTRLAPEECRGKIFTEERSDTITPGMEVPIGPSGQKVQVNDEVARKVNREYELKLSGWKKSSETVIDNVVVWDCIEAKKAAKGVVPGYCGVIIVQYLEKEEFQADFKLDADRGMFNFDTKMFDWLNVFGKKDTDDPVIFNPTKPIGRQYQGLADFKDLNLDHFITLEPIASIVFDSTAPVCFGLAQNALEETASKGQLRPVVDEMRKKGGRDITQKNTGPGKAFRISRVPSIFNASDVQKVLCPQSPATTFIGSLVPDADSIDSVSHKIATVTFESLDAPFLDLQPDYPMQCAYRDIMGRSGSIIVDCSFLGLTALASPSSKSDIIMDLIAVTGLNGHPFASWKERGGSFMWLRDGLPQALPNTRIMIYGYDSKLHGSASFASVSSYGKALLADVISARATPEEPIRPLVFIGHSLGGLLIKEALVYASRADSADKNVFDSTHGLIFLGVPHRGLRVEHLLAMVEEQPNEEFVESLKPESAYLNALHENFGQAVKWKDLTIHSYFETVESKTAKRVGDTWKLEGPPARLVAKSSATGATPGEQPSHQYPMNRSHSDMAKFEDGNSYYKNIRSQLRELESIVSKSAPDNEEAGSGHRAKGEQ